MCGRHEVAHREADSGVMIGQGVRIGQGGAGGAGGAGAVAHPRRGGGGVSRPPRAPAPVNC